jgi:hypothetical protein
MGIDIYLFSHHYSFHLPVPVLVLLSVVALYGLWRLGRYVLPRL